MPDRPAGIAEALGERYTIEGDIAGGAVATLHLAHDGKHHRKVAVKVLRPDVVDAIAGDRFLKEIEIASRLNHPHVVPLFDSGRSGSLLYFVMPFLEGESLRDRLNREGQLPLQEAVALARDVAEALEYAHSQGVIHRDIKPANILLSGGHALVADFGVARAVTNSAKDRLTSAGLTVGTPAYMSPEQAAGREDIDPRTDVYSLGCVLYEMLGGEPPFPGRTPNSVIARHINEPPLPLSALRRTVPRRLEKLVLKALAKAPADRFRSASELQRALEDPRLLETDDAASSRARSSALIRGLAALVAVLAVLGTAWAWWELRPVPLDPNKVLVFPLSDRGSGGVSGGDAGLWIVSALEHTDPLRPIDAYDRLAPSQRTNIDLLPPGQARALAEASMAGHFLTGAITRSGDSLGVSLVLNSTRGDSVVARQTAFGPVSAEAVTQLGLRAMIGIVPRIIDPGRELDLAALRERDPAAIVHWVHGEREYRLSHFEEALDFYERAIEEDSLLALAALKGGQAASWVKDTERAGRLLDVAVGNADRMPLRHQFLARGLWHFNAAHADSAEHYLRLALAEDEEWSEAWMALAEVHHHLFPATLVVDSSDIAGFFRSAALDPGFYPPLIHLAEDAIRKGRLGEAEAYVGTLEEGETNTSRTLKLGLMLQCVAEGPDRASRRDAAAADAGLVLDAGIALATAGYQAPCAKAAFRALIARADIADNLTWGAMLGLQGLLVAEGRYPEALAVLDSAMARGYGEAQFQVVMGALAGAPWDERAEAIQSYAEGRFGDTYEGMSTTPLWLMGAWHAHRGEVWMLEAALNALRAEARNGDGRAATLARALEAQARLLAGDTAGAVAGLEAVRPTAGRVDLGWDVADPLPLRHLTLARLLLAAGRYDEALHVASIFDHAQPIVFLPFIARSLEIRLQAARALGRTDAARQYERRLFTLGHPVDGVVP